MSENRDVIRDLTPDTVICFDDLTQLTDFEDRVATEIDPYYDRAAWAGRMPIRELIYPKRFNGRIVDIILRPVPSPYDLMTSHTERGVKFTRLGGGVSGGIELTSEFKEELVPRYMGFQFAAGAHSSGRGVIGKIGAELYYYPAPLQWNNGPGTISRPHTSSFTGSVKRVVSKPVITEGSLEDVIEESRRIAYETLRMNIRHPIVQPMTE